MIIIAETCFQSVFQRKELA